MDLQVSIETESINATGKYILGESGGMFLKRLFVMLLKFYSPNTNG